MKTSKLIIVILLITVLALGCIYFILWIFNQPEKEIDEIDYMTKEEFINYIQSNDFGVTINDFDGINIEEFVRLFYFTDEYQPEPNYKYIIQIYWNWKLEKEVEPYHAYELKSVESTNEEFSEFQKRFIEAIEGKGMVINPTNRQGHGIEFIIEAKGSDSINFVLAQTKDLGFEDTKTFKIIKRNSPDIEPLNLDFGYFEFAMRNYSPYFYYSKSNQYFIYFSEERSFSEQHFEIIKVFCEVN